MDAQELTYDWSNRPVEFLRGHVFSERDQILGDFGDHILVYCLATDEDYRVYYDVVGSRKVLRELAILEV
jgi:hypothetical protein